MDRSRYYYRLNESIESLCCEFQCDAPSEKQLAKIARNGGFPFNEKNVTPALYEGQPFSDGPLFSLSRWFDTEERNIAHPTLDRPKFSDKKMTDFLMIGMQPMVSRLMGNLRLREQAFLKGPQDLSRAVEMALMSLLFSREPDLAGNPPSDEKILQAAQDNGLRSKEVFLEKLGEYWSINPLTVLNVVTSSKNKVGVASVLPLTDTAYDAIRSGSLDQFDLTKDDIPLKSNNQLIFIGNLRVDDRNHTSTEERTKFLASTLFIQIALLAMPQLNNLRVLSIGGTPENCHRLEENGHVKLKTKLANTDLPLYEIKQGVPTFPFATTYLSTIQAANR